MRILHINGFNEKEKKEKISDIRKNVRDSIVVCLVFCFTSLLLRVKRDAKTVDFYSFGEYLRSKMKAVS